MGESECLYDSRYSSLERPESQVCSTGMAKSQSNLHLHTDTN